MGVETGNIAMYDAALERRQALMGKSGARAVLSNFKIFRIAAFACIGGVLYGYNQVYLIAPHILPPACVAAGTYGVVVRRF